ncbi:hypothetical protein CNMCM7691_004830 [Aspergillus felis]|uniref:Uncharacterized protein n=1 Tax=Aspergillus felis TaxID=1287682 RepID=A0A8H6VEQ4_9EURO|nr:hypothetical protein CNMCM7691_004830 [Aspergillus felis]
MAKYPDSGLYAIMNGEGRFIHITQSTQHPTAKNPSSSDPSHTVLFVNHVDSNPWTIIIYSSDGPTALSLANDDNGAETETHIGHGRTVNWTVKHNGTGSFQDFWKLKNTHTRMYLDVSDSHHLIGATNHRDQPSQYWKFVPIDQSHVYTAAGYNIQLAAQRHLHHPQTTVTQHATATSNLCGDPTCGVTHVCNRDYNRQVQPLGYHGV